MTTNHAMLPPQTITDSTIYITESAVNQLQTLGSQESSSLRVTVLSGGCSGFQYKFDFERTAGLTDLVFTYHGIAVLTDEISYDLLKGVTLDYVQELIGSAFTLKNPNASQACGCGNSFSI
jgi:iron-sulfur cluster insertion protein